MLASCILCGVMFYLVSAEPPVQGFKPTNVIGSPDQHASFSFVRPGLTQTAFAFNGPSSHQSFSSTIGNPQLIHKVLPHISQSLAHRNPGLGFFPGAPIPHGYAIPAATGAPVIGPSPASYQIPLDYATALAYLQQHQYLQNPTQLQGYSGTPTYQGQLLALRQAQLQFQQQQPEFSSVPEQIQLQQQEQPLQQQQTQNLLGVAYSSAPSVAHVKVSGNGYKFNF